MLYQLTLINGPNLNLLGSREPGHYGTKTLKDIERECMQIAADSHAQLTCYQSNHEGEILDCIHMASNADAILINAGAYTHTSIAIRDALMAIAKPVFEVHLSNIYQRESFRHHSYIADIAVGSIVGLGSAGYEYAIRSAIKHCEKIR